jgi:hypothetical protein
MALAVNNMSPATLPYLNAYTMKNYKYMAFLWQQKKFFNDALSVSLTAILDVYQKPSETFSRTTMQTYYVLNGSDTIGVTMIPTTTQVTRNFPNTTFGRGTVGLHFAYNRKKLGATASGFYQGGHYKDGREISAFMLAGSVSFQIVKPFRLMIGDDFLSGNNYSDTTMLKTKLTGFSTLWGTNHSFYGYMDMYGIYLGRDALQYGLNDLYARGTFTFNPKTSLELTYRMFSMPYEYLPSSGTSKFIKADKNLGSEIDLMLLYKPFNNFELNAAYCYYFKSETRERVDGLKPGTGRNGQYAYVMITYKPQFFSSDKK